MTQNEATVARKKEEYSVTLANLEEVQAKLKSNNTELKMNFSASQEEVVNLSAAVSRLSK